MQDRSPSRRIAFLSIFSLLSILCSYVEILIPLSFGIPGIKLGLANLVSLLILFVHKKDTERFSKRRLLDALLVLLVRIFLIALLFGNVSALPYSLGGGIASLLVMWVLSSFSFVHVAGTSLIGGIVHNLVQLGIAMVLVDTLQIIWYMPVLLFAGTITGFLLGLFAVILLNRKGIWTYYDRFFER